MCQSFLNLEESQPRPTYLKQHITWAKRKFATVVTEIQTLQQLVSHPNAGASTKLVAACTVGYLFSPLQLIPSFIPVIGQLDDLLVVYVGMKLVRRLTPPAVISECESKALCTPFSLSFRSKASKEAA
jgi:uncharacterized membrane protein YkvA (DUF1232 family)